MIINSVSYGITYSLKTNWSFSITDKYLTTGYPDRDDRGFPADSISSEITVKGLRDDLTTLINYLKSDRSIYIKFDDEEDVFGAHIDYSGYIPCVASDVSQPQRINYNYWTISFIATTKNLTLKTGIAETLDNLWYPDRYSAGDETLDENSFTDSYGDFNNYYTGTVPRNILTFELGEDNMAEALYAFTNVIRADGFVLPNDWQSIKPFGETTYTHAFLVGLSFTKQEIDDYRLSIELLGYNNG